MAAMYGNNAPKMGTGILEDSKDWGAIALGRNERRSELNELQQKVLFFVKEITYLKMTEYL